LLPYFAITKLPMKLKMIPTNKLAALCATFCAVMLAFSTNAKATTLALNFGDTYDVGSITPDGGGDAERTTYINVLIGMAPNATNTVGGQTYVRTANAVSSSPAVFALNGPGTSPQNQTVTIDLGSGGYTYLYAKYDGPAFGAEVWNIAGLSGLITIPNFAGPNGALQLSGYTLFTGTGGVPDGGTTVMLLGVALGALGVVRRYLTC
jgi:hypothetical protein